MSAAQVSICYSEHSFPAMPLNEDIYPKNKDERITVSTIACLQKERRLTKGGWYV